MANNKNSVFNCGDFINSDVTRYFLTAFLTVLILWVGVKFLEEAKDLSKPDIGAPTINISGEGKVLAKPDIGTVNLSVVSSSLDASLAQNEAAGQINKIMSFLTNSGIEEKDIKTISYGINAQYDFPKELGVKLGAVVSFSEFGGPVPFYGYAAGLGMGGDFEKSVAPSIPAGES